MDARTSWHCQYACSQSTSVLVSSKSVPEGENRLVCSWNDQRVTCVFWVFMCAACCLLLECSSRLVLLRMVYSDYVKQRIFAYYRCKKNCAEIARCLAEEGHLVTKVGVVKFLRCYKETGSISHKPGTSWASKITASIHDTIKKQIEKD